MTLLKIYFKILTVLSSTSTQRRALPDADRHRLLTEKSPQSNRDHQPDLSLQDILERPAVLIEEQFVEQRERSANRESNRKSRPVRYDERSASYTNDDSKARQEFDNPTRPRPPESRHVTTRC